MSTFRLAFASVVGLLAVAACSLNPQIDPPSGFSEDRGNGGVPVLSPASGGAGNAFNGAGGFVSPGAGGFLTGAGGQTNAGAGGSSAAGTPGVDGGAMPDASTGVEAGVDGGRTDGGGPDDSGSDAGREKDARKD